MANNARTHPKRRRTDSGPSIAQTNTTIQTFTGQRQNRWMQDPSLEDVTIGPSAQELPLCPPSSTAQHEQDLATLFPDRDAHGLEEIEAFLGSSAPAVEGTTNGTAVVVTESEGAGTAPRFAAPYRAPSTRSARSSTIVNPGLPSPAPSEENNGSPIMLNPTPLSRPVPIQAQQPHQSPSTAAPVWNSRTGTWQRSPAAPGRSSSFPGVSLQSHQTQTHLGVQSAHHAPILTRAATQKTGLGPSSQLSLAMGTQQRGTNQQRPPPVSPPRLQHLSDFLDLGTMLRQIDGQMQLQEQPNFAAFRKQGDIGRLCLLREAIEKHDWQYIVLSQLSCLRTVDPYSLPAAMSGLDPKCHEFLDALLCSNNDVQPRLVHWFARFPTPIMAVFSSPAKEPYERMVYGCVAFLQRLPYYWPKLAAASEVRRAPPLTQDIIEALRLESVVLQTAAFRAIARRLFGLDSELCVDALMALHSLDQVAWRNGVIRGPAAKQVAYNALAIVFTEWSHHHQWQAQSSLRKKFEVSPNVRAVFAPPRSSPNGLAETQQAAMLLSQHQQRAASPQTLASPGMVISNAPWSQLPLQSPRVNANAEQRSPAVQVSPAQQQMQSRPRALLPGEQECPRAQPTHPDSVRSALHQAHLRSPVLGSAELLPDMPQLYRHVVSFGLAPVSIEKDLPMSSYTFDLSQEIFSRLPKMMTPHDISSSEPAARALDQGSRTFRLGCVKPPTLGLINESAWVMADNVWPENIYFGLNDQALETRRKLQHGRYIPIDVTQYLRVGANKLDLLVNRATDDTRPFDYAVAIEEVGVTSHDLVTGGIQSIAAEESLATIKQSLQAPEASGDSDLVLTSSTMTIKLFDPISGSKIFDTPVRGIDCLHKDPFDLEIFLSVCERRKPGWPSVADCWRCPICRGDVRPQNLVTDGFLVDVRKVLAAKGLLDTRAIVIEADGRWRPKEEEKTGVRSESLERELKASSAAAPKAAPVVIEIDSD